MTGNAEDFIREILKFQSSGASPQPASPVRRADPVKPVEGNEMNEKERVRSAAACEAAYVLNDAVGALLVPKHVAQVATRFFDAGRMTSRYAGSLQRLAMQSAIINVYRVKEVRDHLLVSWLFSDEELRALGLPPIEEFVGDWSAFIAVRGQYAGHVLSRRSSRSRPGRIVAPEALGRALLRAGLWDAESFLRRVERHLISGIERVRDELFTRYPECREFVRRTYLDRLKSVIPEEAVTRTGSPIARRPDAT